MTIDSAVEEMEPAIASDEVDGADLAALGQETADRTVDTVDDDTTGPQVHEAPQDSHRPMWLRVLAYGVLPGLVLVLALAAGYLKWQDSSLRGSELARAESVQVAKDSTVALLSYRPDTVERDLGAARDRLTGKFLDSYTSLTNDIVIPGAKQKRISTVATVPAAASVSANQDQAVVMVFVDQSVSVGAGPPTDTASTVKVSLDNVDGRWLISGFDPV